MRALDFDHLADGEVLPALSTWNARERSDSVMVIGLIAVADARKLYLPAGYPSMAAYCVGQLRLSEDAAFKRIDVARKARQYPAIFAALEEGRLHMTAVLMLAPYLTPERADGLLAAATHKTKAEIEQMLAACFPRSERLPLVQAIPASGGPLAPEGVAAPSDPSGEATHELAPERVAPPARRAKAAPIAADRFEWQLTVGRSAQEKLQHARNLLSHQIPSGDMAEVLERGLDALIAKLEKARFAATDRPRTGPRRIPTAKRTIPAHVRRAVRERDQDQCAFVGENGRRCSERKGLQFDHVDPVARGGGARVENVRLLCRAHNQYEAERVFGSGFMDKKRERARRVAAEARAKAEAAEEGARTIGKQHSKDVLAGLRELGVRADLARRAVEYCETLRDATIEDRMRAALKFVCPKASHRGEGMNGRA